MRKKLLFTSLSAILSLGVLAACGDVENDEFNDGGLNDNEFNDNLDNNDGDM